MKRLAVAILVLSLGAAVLSPGSTRAEEAVRSLDLRRLDTAVVAHGMLPSLRDRVLVVTPRARDRRSIQDSPSTYIDLGGTPRRDPLVVRARQGATGPDLIASFEGIASTGFVPPDPIGDVGPNHYVMAVNPSMAIFDKSGNLVLGPTDMRVLWGPVGGLCATSGQGDPIVQYDTLAGRWLLSEFAFAEPAGQPSGPFFQCVAISKTSDPLGAFDVYAFKIADSLFPDFPKFGVWPDAYYMTVHLFEESTGAYAGQGVYAFDRTKMLQGTATADPIGFTDPSLIGVLPADLDGSSPPPSGSPNYLVAVEDDAVGFPNDRLEVFRFEVDFATPSNSTITPGGTMSTPAFDHNMCSGNFECLPQKGTTRRLDAIGDGVIMYRLAYRNFGTHESMLVNHVVDVDGRDRAGIRWYEIRDPGGSPRIHQQGTFSPDSKSRWLSSMAMDLSGNIAMGYSVTGSDQFPSIRYTGRSAGDPLGALSAEAGIIEGGGAQTGSPRWGDYTSMTVDPEDDCTFWYVQEYYPQTSVSQWRTRIATLRFPGCSSGGSPLPQPSPTPSPEPQPTPTPAPSEDLIAGVNDRPDPFSPNGDGRKERVKIFFRIQGEQDAAVRVTVLNRRGRLVRVLSDSILSPGEWVARWGGRNKSGRKARAGTYTYRIEASDGRREDVASGTVALRR